jgi:hypothetical protein
MMSGTQGRWWTLFRLDKPPGTKVSLVLAFVLAAFAIYSVIVVGIAIASNPPHGHRVVFWPSVAVILFLAGWAVHGAKRLWRRARPRTF